LLEALIREQILDNPHSLLLTMAPKAGLEMENNKKSIAEWANYKATLSAKEIERLESETKELIKYQEQKDTPEALATIPLLNLEDIDPTAKWYPVKEKNIDTVPVLCYHTFTNHVVYTSLLFDARVLPQWLVPYASLLTEVLGSLSTEKYTYGELDNELNIHTGIFSTIVNSYLEDRKDENLLPKVVVFSKALNTKVDKLFELTEEIINHTIFSDKDRLKTVLRRHHSILDARIKRDGMDYARTRLASYYSNQGMFNELTDGIEYYWFITDLVNNFDKNSDEIIANLEDVAQTLFSKDNLIITVTCEKEDLPEFCNESEKFINRLSKEKPLQESWKFAFDNKNEGFLSASKVQYVLPGYDFKKLGYSWHGKYRAMNQILSREWLNNQIRVIGGAYGGFSHFSSSGQVYFASYRDPNLKRTLENFAGTPKFIRKFEPDKDTMTRFIIGTISRMDRPLRPSAEGNLAVRRYLEKISKEDVQTERDAVLATTAQDIREMEAFVADILKQETFCVYGNEEKIESNKNLFKKIRELER